MQTFIEQFKQLLLTQPRYNLKIVNSENCDYADTALNSKNCYYTFGIFHGEDVYFSRYSRNCTSSSDLTFCFDCEWCYADIACSKCYSVDFSQYCANCTDCKFCSNCRGCSNCFGCTGMANKQYYIFNKQVTKDEYEAYIKSLDLANPAVRAEIERKMEELKRAVPQLAIHQTMTEDCVGDNIVQGKNCYQCFDVYDLEDCAYCIETNSLKNCCDMTVCFKTEESYQCMHSPGCYNCNFCYHCDYCSDSEFCAYSKNLKNCFGCVYMKDKEYHILNKPFAPDAYFVEVARIKDELKRAGMYNLQPYFITDYETQRLAAETEPAIAASVPIL